MQYRFRENDPNPYENIEAVYQVELQEKQTAWWFCVGLTFSVLFQARFPFAVLLWKEESKTTNY